MPTYEYRCKACGHEFEQFQSMTARPLRTCPACSKSTLERLIGTGAAIVFKGSGFYQTDYRSESYKSAAKADAPPSADAKPADAPTPKDKPTADAAAPKTPPTPSDAPADRPAPARVRVPPRKTPARRSPKPRRRR